MFTLIPVISRLPIANGSFARWYSRGVWWALHGDYQGNGPYADTYLIDNVRQAIRNGWYHDRNSERLRSSGFFLGMIHGGNIDPKTYEPRQISSIVMLTDPDFQRGYESGRHAPRVVSDQDVMYLLYAYASSCATTHALSYASGTIIRTLSHATMHAPPFCEGILVFKDHVSRIVGAFNALKQNSQRGRHRVGYSIRSIAKKGRAVLA